LASVRSHCGPHRGPHPGSPPPGTDIFPAARPAQPQRTLLSDDVPPDDITPFCRDM